MFFSINDHAAESKAFSKSIKSSNPRCLWTLLKFKVSKISLMLSPVKRSDINPVRSKSITEGRTFLIRLAIHPEPIL